MKLQPIGDNRQKQSLTTALKNICRDYPAGGNVLRELLQNADDAGATEVRFFLDQTTYPVDSLIDTELGKYQGPALLAYNNAVFTDTDFENLSRLGDSLKINDGSTTGKFGRGFNSVFNWTDSPSIVTRDRLLILDPHTEWSTGGPVYDFVSNSETAEIKSQMEPFQSAMQQLDRRLDGTIIRIPLRNQAQMRAMKNGKSDISDRETTVSEVLEVLRSFAFEFRDSGLLFMRNVEKLEFGSDGMSIVIQMGDGKTLRSHKLKVNDAVKRALKDPEYLFNHSFEAGIEFRSAGESRKTSFMVHHSIQYDFMEAGLRDWAKDQKLIPWVAVAAQLPIKSTETIKGSLSTVLPLPVPTCQPVHIHGLFSISPDRARLHEFSDRSTQDQNPAKWNDWLLQGPVPIAWTKLLSYFSQVYPHQSAFERWPQSVDNTQDSLRNAVERVVACIEKDSLALWPTNEGYVRAQDGLLAAGVEPALRDALREARVPVVYVPQRLQRRVEDVFKDRLLCPQSLSSFMKRKRDQVGDLSDCTKHKILEYFLSEPGFMDYGGLEIFPFRDGVYRSIEESSVYVHRDKLEEILFNLEDSRNLDVEKLSDAAQRALRQGCESSTNHPLIRYRSSSCLREYCLSTIFKNVAKDEDIVLPGMEPGLVTKIWTWLSKRRVSIDDKDISSLWLLPLSNGKYRKVVPRNASSLVYLAPMGEIGDLMWKYDAKMVLKPLPLFDIGSTGLVPDFVVNLTANPTIMSKLFLKDAKSIVVFLEWFNEMSFLVEDVPDQEKLSLARLIASNLPNKLTSSERRAVALSVTRLQIFQRVSWKVEGEKMEPGLAWTTLNACKNSVGVLDGLSPIPDIGGVQFLIAEPSSPSKQLLQDLGLADCLESFQIIQDHIIPAWQGEESRSWTSSCKEQVAAFILRQISRFPKRLLARIRRVPMIPVQRLDGQKTSKFALATDLIDPSVPELEELCFDDEEIVPKHNFFRDFGTALKICGLKIAVDEAFVIQRVRCYATGKYPLLDVQRRAKKLLESPCRRSSPLEPQEASDLRHLKWLPANYPGGPLYLKASGECRGQRDRLLVSSELPVVEIPISSDWEERLGWNAILPSHILLSQLSFGIEKKDRKIVDAVLTYISGMALSELVADDLKIIPCILASSGLFVTPSQAVRHPKSSIAGYEGLQPYLTTVDRHFWNDHESLLTRLGIGDLQPTDLLQVQATLEEKVVLDEADVAVAIEVLNLASQFPSNLTGLKAISQDRTFHPIHDIDFNDLAPLNPKQKVNLTHQDIPKRTIQRLRIGNLSERLLKGMLELEDFEDEDEFDQRENVITRISNTLDRYPVETTFREYLANADDATGASKISWLLDERIHPNGKLLTPEMKKYQGPAFLVRNDSVFSEKDFKGFKNVGEGSKAHDKESIGKFGQGSQTMYHWTDVPMILSGEWLLILDPQQQVLPWNRKTGKRKPGVKVLLSKVRDACRDQLAPFEGLWDYTQPLDHYPGTIFRFPLRTAATSPFLRTSQRNLDSSEVNRLMATYFHEARISLLFLRRITSIDFNIHGQSGSGWSVTRSSAEDAQLFSELVTCEFSKSTGFGARLSGKDKWLVAIEDLQPAAKRLPDDSRRVMKNVECGIAALISSKFDPHDSNIVLREVLQSRMFNTLPLPISSDLPVHIHATFFLSGDRQSIAIDEYGAQSYGSEWNRYLLEKELPKLYLSLLDNIVPKVGQNVFKFWPREDPPKRSCSELICNSFWKELATSTNRLFPKAQPSKGFSQRRPPELFDITQAVFDFLPKNQSEILAPLLISLDINLVRNIPLEVAKRLKALPEVKTITGSLLRSLLKSDKARVCLSNEMQNNPLVLEELLRQLLPTVDDLKDLDGCQILPLADGSLAKLKFTENNNVQSPTYYVASKEELKLFEFASKSLVPSSTSTKFQSVIKSGKFNLKTLQLCHVTDLLKLRPEISTPTPEGDKWLTEFWEYWNGSIDPSLQSSNLDTLDVKIFRATRNGVDCYVSPVSFHLLPAVVEPSIGEHQELCNGIPGLYSCDIKFMPKLLTDDESSLYKKNSFYRFIRALRRLANLAGMGLGIFLEKNLDLSRFQVNHPSPQEEINLYLIILRNLVTFHVSNEKLGKESNQFLGFSSDLKLMPLWPHFHSSSPEQLLSANNALLADNHHLLVPWMKDCHRFVNIKFASDAANQACLLKLGVKNLPVEVLLRDHVLPLPSTLSNSLWGHFRPFIADISKFCSTDSSNAHLSLLSRSKIAADGYRDLKRAEDLYDHDDQIFISAFRKQKETKFLHDCVKEYRPFWLRVGLCHRTGNIMNPAHYIQCLQELEGRLISRDAHNDPHLSQDSQTVLSLMTTVNSNTHHFSSQDWRLISEQAVFQSRTVVNGESEYRQNKMASVAAEKQILSLSNIVSHRHVAVCWSQTPFALLEPTREILSKYSGNGRPTIEMVWRHLKHMASIAPGLKRYQAQDFLKDLHLTYEYLQDRLDESTRHFDANLKNSAIWLNLDTTDHNMVLLCDLESSWHEVGQLVLSSSCDTGVIKAVRPGLMRYEKLLRALGCNSIIYPTITRPTLHLGSSISNSLRRLRNEGKLLDVTFSAEGRLIQAHRVVLAAMSTMCASQFNGQWRKEDVIQVDDDTDPDGCMSYHTLSTMINYAYEDEINWEEMEVSGTDNAFDKVEKLDLLLDLYKGADYWDIPALMSQVQDKILVAGGAFMNLENVLEIRERAGHVRAKAVEEMCAEFIKKNQELVRKAHSGNS